MPHVCVRVCVCVLWVCGGLDQQIKEAHGGVSARVRAAYCMRVCCARHAPTDDAHVPPVTDART